jgi:polysaccharide biosynthesis transport protein
VQLRAQQERLAAQLQAVQGRLGSAHPEVQGLNRQFAEGQRALAAEAGRVVAAIEADQHAAAERVRALEAALRDAEAAAERTAREQIPLNAMTRDLETARAQLQSVLERMHQVAHQVWIELPEAREISQAIPPEHSSSPKTMAIMAAASAAGVFLSLLLVYLLHLTDNTIRSGEELRLITGLPCFAAIPEISRRALGHLAIEEYGTRRPLTAFAEHIRTVRASLSLSADRPIVVGVTAARPAEGKSLLAISLGRSAQLSGERVLTVGCDVRRPLLQAPTINGPPAGLLDILRGTAAWENVVQNDPLTGMHVIPAGKPGGDVPGFFLSEDMRRFLAAIRASYDLVLLDAPPVEAVTEARIVAALADATLLCVRWRWTPRAALHHALDVLQDARARVIGTVLTRVNPHAHLRAGSAGAGIYHRRYKAYDRGSG